MSINREHTYGGNLKVSADGDRFVCLVESSKQPDKACPCEELSSQAVDKFFSDPLNSAEPQNISDEELDSWRRRRGHMKHCLEVLAQIAIHTAFNARKRFAHTGSVSIAIGRAVGDTRTRVVLWLESPKEIIAGHVKVVGATGMREMTTEDEKVKYALGFLRTEFLDGISEGLELFDLEKRLRPSELHCTAVVSKRLELFSRDDQSMIEGRGGWRFEDFERDLGRQLIMHICDAPQDFRR